MGEGRGDRGGTGRVVFRRWSRGPLQLTLEPSARVRGPQGPEVELDASHLPVPEPGAPEAFQYPVQRGLRVLVDGEAVATAQATLRELAGIVKPGRISITSEDPTLDGLVLRGHLLPQRLTLADAAGPLVWSPWPLGLLNLHLGPVVVVPPKVADRALPVHVALWLAAWWSLEGNF